VWQGCCPAIPRLWQRLFPSEEVLGCPVPLDWAQGRPHPQTLSRTSNLGLSLHPLQEIWSCY
jgi:hypothetical protein